MNAPASAIDCLLQDVSVRIRGHALHRGIKCEYASSAMRVAGTSGPLPQEIDWDCVAERAGLNPADLHEREVTTTTHRPRRVGEFDWELFRRACTLNGPTDLALSFADYIDGDNQNARRFEQLSPDTIRFIEELERVGDANVSLISTRFHPRSIIDRRAW